MRALASLAAFSLMTGCASNYASLIIHSQPPGAYVTADGTGMGIGVTPATAYWERGVLERAGKDSRGCYLVSGFKAQWVSGASTEIPPVPLCHGIAEGYSITVSRNPAVPGLDKDLQFALQIQTMLAQQQQARAAEGAAAAALIGAFSAAQRNNNPVRCTSYPIGDTVHTTCK